MKNIFRSQLTYDILKLFTDAPNASMFLAEIAKSLQRNPANVSRELSRLVYEDILITKTKQGKKYYALNKSHVGVPHITKMISVAETEEFEKNIQGDWLLGEDIPNLCPFFSKIWMNCFMREFADPGGRAYKKGLVIHEGYHMWFYFDQKDAVMVGKHLVERFVKQPDFMKQVNEQIVVQADILKAFADALPEMYLEKLSNKKLLQLYVDHERIHTQYYQWGWIPVAADMFGNNLTDYSKELLHTKGVVENKVEEYLMLLTHPKETSLIKEEQDALMQIGIGVQHDKKEYELLQQLYKKFKEQDVKKFGLYTHSMEYEEKFEEMMHDLQDQLSEKTKKALHKHYQKYYYTKFIFTEEQGVYSYEHYLKSLVRLVNGDPNLEKTFQEEQKNEQYLLQKKRKLIKKLHLSTKEIVFFEQWGGFMVTKIYRRFAQIFALYRMTPIVEEIGKRVGLTLKQARFMTTEEVQRGLEGKSIDTEEIKRRVQLSVFYTDKEKEKFYTGSQAKKIRDMLQQEETGQISEIKGQCGCQGYAKGVVRIVNDMSEMQKMKEGDILVSIATQPNLLPAMKRAAAFVTNQGGVTSHAAIVAREMKTPCIIGTKVATAALHDGDLVEVDANSGVVRVIKRAE